MLGVETFAWGRRLDRGAAKDSIVRDEFGPTLD